MRNLVVKPVITEHSMKAAAGGIFTFAVFKMVRKPAIKKEIEKKFSVNVVSLSTSILKGGRKRVGKRMIEKVLSPWKKVMVKLAKDQKISLFDIGEKTK